MTLAPGSRLGPYEITAPIGSGGMGEVFRARDTKLNRDVAIKVLPAAFAQDAERVARFRREAQVLASLNHPDIAAIYGLEEADGVVALALELVEGEELAERLKRGAIPVDESIALAKQIAEGLEAAHEKGIVHRDLKPANVKLTKDGAVKLLDFGLAKAYEGDTATTSSSGLSQSPTMSRQMTEAGLILGTAAYMSPEQARGKPVDKRADIWSFGVVLLRCSPGSGSSAARRALRCTQWGRRIVDRGRSDRLRARYRSRQRPLPSAFGRRHSRTDVAAFKRRKNAALPSGPARRQGAALHLSRQADELRRREPRRAAVAERTEKGVQHNAYHGRYLESGHLV